MCDERLAGIGDGREARREGAYLQSVSWAACDASAEDEKGAEEEAGEEGAGDENGLESDDGGGSAERRRYGRVETLVVPL